MDYCTLCMTFWCIKKIFSTNKGAMKRTLITAQGAKKILKIALTDFYLA